ncbi:MAG TPA: hypothetical protein VLV45_03370 [Gemmatimonadales bacterium]|nr:hypothetical protein [Gemmatimonadales bacterium]
MYAGESQVVNLAAVDAFPPALIDPIQRAPEVVAKWVPSAGLANGLAVRHTQMFGLGLCEWRFRSEYAYPELEIGDVIAIQVDQFLAYDPIATRAIAGKNWAMGVIVGKWDALGHDFSIWIQSYTAIQPIATSTLQTLAFDGPGNWVVNSDMVDGLSYWDHYELSPSLGILSLGDLYLSHSTLELQSGVAGDAIVSQRSARSGSVTPRYIRVAPGDVLTVAAIGKYDGAAANNAYVDIIALDASYQQLSVTPVLHWNGAGDTAFNLKSGTYTVPANAIYIVVALEAAGGGGPPLNCTAMFTHIIVKR